MEQGTINVQTENIFPIIKKFLYSDHEIFLRELVSNGVDACTKLQTMAAAGKISTVLEIGTGSGYQTCVLAQMVEKVFTVERIKPLLES